MNRVQWTNPGSLFPSVKEGEASILFLGDVALARGIGRSIDRHGPAFPFARIPRSFFEADILCFNLECCLSTRGLPWEPKPVHLRGTPAYLSVFPPAAGSIVANVANNHFLDYGEEAALDTLSELDNRGIQYVGANIAGSETRHRTIRTKAGSIAFLGYAPSAHPLGNRSAVDVPSHRPENLRDEIQTAKKTADLVIAIFHTGVEYCRYVDRASRRLAHFAVESGADCVVCHHAHVTQGIESVRDGYIFHGLGNFLLDISPDRRPEASMTIAPRLWIKNGKIVQVEIHPFSLNDEFQPCPLEDDLFESFRERTEHLSRLLASPLGRVGNSFAASWKRSILQSTSAMEMLRHKGVRRTASYYAGRIQERLTG